MGSYVNNNLSRDEKVIYEAHYHWKIWIEASSIFSLFIRPLIKTKTDEFVITNKRIIMKTGIISRNIFEMTASHIESINGANLQLWHCHHCRLGRHSREFP